MEKVPDQTHMAMGKYYENDSTFGYTWEQLTTAFWRRYPNPYSSHVLSEDTLCRELRDGGNCLYTKRLLTKTNRAPKWGERFIKSSNVAIVEESYVNLKERTLTTYTRNIGYNKIMSITEKVVYTPEKSDSNSTIANRQAWVDSQMYGFRRPIEAFGLDRFKNNCHQAVQGFNYILKILFPSQESKAVSATSDTLKISRMDGTKEKLKEKAKKASKIAEQLKLAVPSSTPNIGS